MSYVPGIDVTLSNKGDLITRDATDPTVLPVGLEGQKLVARAAAATGLAWESDAASSKDGSIFSMVGPTGAPNALVAYDFTQYDPSLTLAQNLAAANISGVPGYNLFAVGAPIYSYSGKYLPGQGLQPYHASLLGGGLVTDAVGAANATTNLGADNTLRILGEITIEILLGAIALDLPGGTVRLITMTGTGETEDTNNLYALEISTGMLKYAAERDAGVNIDGDLASIASFVGAGYVHFTLTRTAAGLVTGYLQGKRVSALVTPVSGGGSIIPTRGAVPTQNLILGNTGTANGQLLWAAAKITAGVFTDAQVNESYHKTIFGRA